MQVDPTPERGRSYLGRLLDLLDIALTDEGGPLSLTELANKAKIPLSTTSRLATMLVERGMLRTLPDGRLDVGSGFVHIAVRALSRIRADAQLRTAVKSLALATGESASAGLLVGDAIVLVAREEPEHSLRAVARVGDIIAPHTSAMGKAILARLDPDGRMALLRRAVGADAERLDAELAPELAEVQRTGHALDEETFSVGLRCRAAAFLDQHGLAVGGISIAGPAARFSFEQATQSLPQLMAAVHDLSITIPTARRPA